MKQVLCEIKDGWSLAMMPNREVVQKKFCPVGIRDLRQAGLKLYPATVPGNFELDIFRAGVAPDPFYAQGPYFYQQFENRHLWYVTCFESPDDADENTFLLMEGVDTVADIYVNGTFLYHTENMLIGHRIPVAGTVKQGKNELLVHIFPASIEARKYELTPINYAQTYNYDSLHIRKAAFMFGWDIMPRFVSGGIWKPVSLIREPAERLEQCYLYTSTIERDPDIAHLKLFFRIHTVEDSVRELKITVEGSCGDSGFFEEKYLWHTEGHLRFLVKDPKLWYPKNAGEPDLYRVRIRLWRSEHLCDEKLFSFGIRTVRLLRAVSGGEGGRGDFRFLVNDKPVFCMGTNWVPLDAFPSRYPERLEKALHLLRDLGCNMVRVWGGNVYECEAFYDFCDRNGILVWQDFCMGCAVYPQDDAFAEKIRTEAISVIRRLRNHASLALWAGDNECDQNYARIGGRIDPNTNRLTRNILAQAVMEHDPSRAYIPSSPYVDPISFERELQPPEDHLWGARDYFKGDYYSNSHCNFASEIGYHGCPSPGSLKKYISAEQLWPFSDPDGKIHPDWICHASSMEVNQKGSYYYRIRLMAEQVKMLFGEMGDTLEEFAKKSQISQAEAKKFFIEHFRIGKWYRTGIIWWNLLDGWPQISDAVVDWYGVRKLAYHYIKRSQQPLCLMFDEPVDGTCALYAVNDTQEEQAISYVVTDLTDRVRLAEGNFRVPADCSVPILKIPARNDFHFWLMEWRTEAGVCGKNHYATMVKNISYPDYDRAFRAAGLDEFEEF